MVDAKSLLVEMVRLAAALLGVAYFSHAAPPVGGAWWPYIHLVLSLIGGLTALFLIDHVLAALEVVL
jgi:hypothetical protein